MSIKTWEEIVVIEPKLEDLRKKAAESKSSCYMSTWYGVPYGTGLKYSMAKLVGWSCSNNDLCNSVDYSTAQQKIYGELPDCTEYCDSCNRKPK